MKAEDVWEKLHPIDLGIVTKEDAINFSKVIAELAFDAGVWYKTNPIANNKETFINELFNLERA